MTPNVHGELTKDAYPNVRCPMMELLQLDGEGVEIGDMHADALAKFAGMPALSVQLSDGRVVVLIGMTREECKACLPAFLAPARIKVCGV